MKNQHIAIIGAGNMATALAWHLGKQGNDCLLYCIEPEVEDQINRKHSNDKYLAGITLPKSIKATSKLDECLEGADTVIVSIPSGAVLGVLEKAKRFIRKDAAIAVITKGFDIKSLEPIAIAARKVLPSANRKKVCMLGGPAIATELVKGTPMAFVVGCEDEKTGKKISKLLTHGNVKVARSNDLMGVSLAAALKNAYAIALGFCDGLGYATNAKAFVITMAVSEMAGIMLKAGAQPKTAPSLAGLGDLLVTGLSPHGRNRKYGERLVRAQTNDPHRLGLTTVEGISASDLSLKLAKKYRAKTPLLAAIQKGIHAKANFHQPFVAYLKDVKLDLI